MRGSEEDRRGSSHPLLGLIAYVLVPGERRSRAAGHMRKAALELARGLHALAVPARYEERRPGDGSSEKIEIR